jgi:hypothetical protein
MPSNEEMIALIKGAAKEGQLDKMSIEEMESIYNYGSALSHDRPYDEELIDAVNQFKIEIERRNMPRFLSRGNNSIATLLMHKQQYHVVASIILFLASLFFPGFYVGYPSQPWASILLLLTGWLGILDVHFSWFANPFYVLALILRRSKRTTSLYLELISLLLATSFLLYRTIVVSEAPTYAPIAEYGWGYYLWILAIAVLFIGDLSEYFAEKKQNVGFVIKHSVPLIVGIITVLFLSHHFFGVHSQFQVERHRDKVFQEKCKLAGEIIYKKSDSAVNGIYFHHFLGGYSYDGVNKGIYSSSESKDVAGDMLVKGLITFYEVDNDDNSKKNPYAKPYRRIYLGDPLGVEVESLNSEYTVTTKYLGTDMVFEHYSVQSELDIQGYEITIIENKSQFVMAKTTYFSTPIGCKFCGCSVAGKFSNEDFLMRVLNINPSKDK